MKKYYSVSIPKPCHEDWNAMTPKEKGRFCNSCNKTVIDFTKMDTYEIQDFINDNKGNNVCGHFKQTQLDSINLHIPSQVLEQQKSFHKIFLLALLIAMGTSLMNCTNKNGDTQKIDSIEVVDSIVNNRIDTTKVASSKKDSIKTNTCSKPTMISKDSLSKPILPPLIPPQIIDGMIEITGDLVIDPPEPNKTIDSLNITLPLIGLIVPETPVKDEEDIVLGFIQVETPPEFKDTPNNLSIQEKRDYFSKQIKELVTKNYNTEVCSNLTGRQRILTQFKIDKEGHIIDVKARAPNIKLEEEAKRVIKLLPQFIPAKQNGKPVDMIYTLPILFQAEE